MLITADDIVCVGTEAGLRLCLSEVISVILAGLTSSSWTVKAQAGAAAHTVADKLGGQLGPPHLGMLLTALVTAVPGRTWTGKEALLKAISLMTVNCQDQLQSARDGQPTVADVVEVMLKECRKENIEYKMEALQCTSAILHSYDIDRIRDVADIVLPLLPRSSVEGRSGDVVSSSLEEVDRDTRLQFQQCAYECVGKCWPSAAEGQAVMQQSVADVLCCPLVTGTWKLQLAALRALQPFVSRLCCLRAASDVDDNHDFIAGFTQTLFTSLSRTLANTRYSSVRLESITVASMVIERLSACERVAVVSPSAWQQLERSVSDVVDADSQADLRQTASQLLTIIRSSSIVHDMS